MEPRISIDLAKIKVFCEKWKITEFSLFGSVLTDEFRPDSDVDVLVMFADDAEWSLFDLVHMEDELKVIFGRDVDLVLRKTIERSENYIRRRNILSTARRFYAS
ncbi:MAG: nucleotidyltransferase domain-containing protein [bacterium]|nr:nucleotidyltransferase domain-containing protein [bacterium]